MSSGLKVTIALMAALINTETAFGQEVNKLVEAARMLSNQASVSRIPPRVKVLPTNYNLYGVTQRTAEGGGTGLYVTCDSSEVIVGAYCKELSNAEASPNALLDAGSQTFRSAACKWKNMGTYRVVASCMSFKPLVGDDSAGAYTGQELAN